MYETYLRKIDCFCNTSEKQFQRRCASQQYLNCQLSMVNWIWHDWTFTVETINGRSDPHCGRAQWDYRCRDGGDFVFERPAHRYFKTYLEFCSLREASQCRTECSAFETFESNITATKAKWRRQVTEVVLYNQATIPLSAFNRSIDSLVVTQAFFRRIVMWSR